MTKGVSTPGCGEPPNIPQSQRDAGIPSRGCHPRQCLRPPLGFLVETFLAQRIASGTPSEPEAPLMGTGLKT
jgi:hypothetical protein